MKNRGICIGVIGTGFGASVHVPAFQRAKNCTVVGIASRESEHAKESALRHGIPRVFSDWRELVASPDIDAVSIATPPELHYEIIASAASAGKSILCEKPLCLNYKEASDSLIAVSGAGIVHGVNFLFRGHPVFAQLHRILEEERAAGRTLRHVNVRWVMGGWANPVRPWAWQCDEARGGGVLGALGVHALDYIEWLFGPISRLSAELGIAIHERPGPDGATLPVTAPDHCHMLLTLAGGVSLTCTVSNVAPHGVGHRIEVHGESKTWILNSDTVTDYGRGFGLYEGEIGSLMMKKINLETEFPEGEDGRIHVMTALAERFIDAVSRKTSFEPSFVQGVRTRLLLDRIKEAASDARWVDVTSSLG